MMLSFSPRRSVLALASLSVLGLINCSRDVTAPVGASRPQGQPRRATTTVGGAGVNAARDRGPWTVPNVQFLPPLGPEIPKSAGTPDATLKPGVSVCELAGVGTPDARCTTVVASFSATRGTDNQVVHYTGGSGAHYRVEWHTGASSVVAGRSYRITLFAAGAFIGSADVTATGPSRGSGGASGGRPTFVAGQSLSIAFRVDQRWVSSGGSGTIASNGGVVTAVGGMAAVSIPGGALGGGVTITVAPTTSAPMSSDIIGGTTYEFGPTGTTFASSVTVAVSYDPAHVPRGRAQDLRLYTYDPMTLQWALIVGSTVDSALHTVSGATTHFTVYAAGTEPAVDSMTFSNGPGFYGTLPGLPNASHGTAFSYFIGDLFATSDTNGMIQAYGWGNSLPSKVQCDRSPAFTTSDSSIVVIDSIRLIADASAGGQLCGYYGDYAVEWQYPALFYHVALTHPGTAYLRAMIGGISDSVRFQVWPQYGYKYLVRGLPAAIAKADVNGDGKIDLITGNLGEITSLVGTVAVRRGSVAVLLGNGDGTFRPAVEYPVGDGSILSVATGDFNRDGKIDIAVVHFETHTVSLLLGNGDGTFQSPSTFPTGHNPFAIVAGDFNGDGKLDLASNDSYDSTISVFLGNGDGTFQPRVTYATLPERYDQSRGWNSSVIAADLDGDGKTDLVVASGASSAVSVLRGNGDGTFSPRVDYATDCCPFNVIAVDVNGDAKLDLVTANYSGNNGISVLLGIGDGTFKASTGYSAQGVGEGTAVAAGDLDGDGRVDLAYAARSGGVAIFLGNGDGTFRSTPVVYPTTGTSIVIHDFNGDGKPDMATANFWNSEGTVFVVFPAKYTVPLQP